MNFGIEQRSKREEIGMIIALLNGKGIQQSNGIDFEKEVVLGKIGCFYITGGIIPY